MSNLIGRVHSFETFGAVDGPGIRFVIFMQGCSLQCKYCQNRDTWEINAGNQYSAEELLNKILKYKNYFLASGGGVTVSGGEPLLQYKFLIELFTLLKKENIHTAIDTSGNVDLTDDMKKLIDLTDLFLLDIKCINDEICKKLTGVSNKKELAFAKYLSSINKPTWIRQVIVPTITDRTEDLLALKDFLSTLTNVEKIELLPYHDLGKSKWIKLGLKYELENIRVANNNDIEYAKRILGIS
ncbi:MAG: pyruvate formate-lyase-activating protein [Clostridia bacterium]|jgi:pyruvate formate lyase activating enzyme